MSEPEVIPPVKNLVRRRGWIAAYVNFIRSPSENRTLKLVPLALIGIIPLSVLDNLFLPFIGTIDDIPTTLLTIIAVFLTARRVKNYR